MPARFLLIFLSLILFAQSVAADCYPISRIMEPSARLNFQNLCRAAVHTDPACKEIEADKLINCEGTQESNELFNSDNLGIKILSCAKAFVVDSMADLAEMMFDLIKMLVGSQVKSYRSIYKFMTDAEFRHRTLSRNSEMTGLARAFLESSTRNFATEFSKNYHLAVDKVGYLNAPLVALGETLIKPFLKMVVNLLHEVAEAKISEFRCLNSKAKLDAICTIAGSVLMPPAIFFGLLKTGVIKLSSVKGADQLVERTRSALQTEVQTPTPAPEIAEVTPALARVSAASFISQWATKVATTPSQNDRWIRLADQGRQPGMIFVDSQNSALKILNDSISDKSLVDALGNRYNHLVKESLEEFQRLRPGLKLDLYSDYKSIRAAIRGPPKEVEELTRQLQLKLTAVDLNFKKELAQLNVLPKELSKKSIFKSGVGATSEEANIVTRFARRDEDAVVGSFQAPHVQKRIHAAYQSVEVSRKNLEKTLGSTALMVKAGTSGKSIPSEMVFEVLRKHSDPAKIRDILHHRTGVNLSVDDAKLLKTYSEQVDQFSPALIIRERVAHNFGEGINGGFTIDFAGVGAWNLSATAQGLTISDNLDSALSAIRIYEKQVTQRMNEVKRAAKESVDKILARHQREAKITVSGDDMVGIPDQPLSPEIRAELVRAQVSVAEQPSSIRMSYFPPGMTETSDRITRATIGESIEKELRKEIELKIDYNKLRAINFAIDMVGSDLASGQARLLMEAPPGLSQRERQIIIDEFNKAVKKVGEGVEPGSNGAP